MQMKKDADEFCAHFIRVNRVIYHGVVESPNQAADNQREKSPPGTNAFSLQRTSLGGLTTLAKQRIAETGAAIKPGLSSVKSTMADGKFWQETRNKMAVTASGAVSWGAAVPKLAPIRR